jgi:hypothetical protein
MVKSDFPTANPITASFNGTDLKQVIEQVWISALATSASLSIEHS